MERRTILFKAWLGYVPLFSVGLILAYAIQVYVYYRDLGGSVSALEAVGIAAVDITLWLLLSPAVVAVYTQLAGKWRTSIRIAVQVPSAIFFATAHIMLDGLVNELGPVPGSLMPTMLALQRRWITGFGVGGIGDRASGSVGRQAQVRGYPFI